MQTRRGVTLWLTGLSAAGKTTLADAVAASVRAAGHPVFVLDGDALRRGLSKDLGFSVVDRTENIRRTAEVAKLMNEAGVHVVAALISPQASDRAMARALVGEGCFAEIHVATPLEVCEQRDSKGNYRRARDGTLPDFTGVSAPYEPPAHPDLAVSMLSFESIPSAVARVHEVWRALTESDTR